MSGKSQTPQTEGFQAARRDVGGGMMERQKPCAGLYPILLPRKAPENQEEEEEERAELNQQEEPEAAESSAGGP